MARESCIRHPERESYLILREFYLLMTGDRPSAALLSYFEYRANGKLIEDPDIENPDIGHISISDFEKDLLHEATDKHIRDRLKYLESEGFITISGNRFKGHSYQFNTKRVQDCLDSVVIQVRSNDRKEGYGQTTEDVRSNDRTSIYKKYKEYKKEIKEGVPTPEPHVSRKSVRQKSSVVDLEKSTDGVPPLLSMDDESPAPSAAVSANAKKGRRKRVKPTESAYHTEECVRLYKDVWTPMFDSLRGSLDDRKNFVHGFDKLIESGVPLSVIVEGTEYYCAQKMAAVRGGRKSSVTLPPDGVRFFLGKNGGESYCLRAFERKQMRDSGEISSVDGSCGFTAEGVLRLLGKGA